MQTYNLAQLATLIGTGWPTMQRYLKKGIIPPPDIEHPRHHVYSEARAKMVLDFLGPLFAARREKGSDFTGMCIFPLPKKKRPVKPDGVSALVLAVSMGVRPDILYKDTLRGTAPPPDLTWKSRKLYSPRRAEVVRAYYAVKGQAAGELKP